MQKTFDSNKPWLYSKDYRESPYILLLFLLWPFGAWLYSIKRANSTVSYCVFFGFSVLLCWHMSPANLEMYDDFIGIMERFNDYSFTTQEIEEQIKSYFTFAADAPKELYENIMIWFVKLYTNNYHVYFALCSIPVALFQLDLLRRVTLDQKYRPAHWYAIACIVMLMTPRDIITVQNPRFTTALWLAIFCTVNYFSDEKKNFQKLLPIIFAPLIHSGLWLFVLLTLIAVILPLNINLLEKVAIITIPLSFIQADFITHLDLSSILPASLYKWSLNHFNPEGTNKISGTGFWWVGMSFYYFSKAVYMYIFYMLYKHKNNVYNNLESKNFYPFFLIIFITSNFVSAIPVLGDRYYWFVQIFLAYLWFKAFYPQYPGVMKLWLLSSSWYFFSRYGYVNGGALSVNTPIDIYYAPLPYLLGKGLIW